MVGRSVVPVTLLVPVVLGNLDLTAVAGLRRSGSQTPERGWSCGWGGTWPVKWVDDRSACRLRSPSGLCVALGLAALVAGAR